MNKTVWLKILGSNFFGRKVLAEDFWPNILLAENSFGRKLGGSVFRWMQTSVTFWWVTKIYWSHGGYFEADRCRNEQSHFLENC